MFVSPPPTPDPGLDPRKLAALRTPTRNLHQLIDNIAAHLDKHDGYLAFSGGKDSLVALHLARQADPQVPVCFFDAQLEFPETYAYIADLAESWDLNLDVIASPRPTLDLLIENGSWSHTAPAGPVSDLAWNKIGAPAAIATARHGDAVLWGVRAEESVGRRIMFATALQHRDPADPPGTCRRSDGTTTYSPVWDWSTSQIWAHIHRTNLPINPVYAKLRALGAPETALRIGAMLDGRHLEAGRLVWLRRGWPQLYELLASVLPRMTEFS